MNLIADPVRVEDASAKRPARNRILSHWDVENRYLMARFIVDLEPAVVLPAVARVLNAAEAKKIGDKLVG